MATTTGTAPATTATATTETPSVPTTTTTTLDAPTAADVSAAAPPADAATAPVEAAAPTTAPAADAVVAVAEAPSTTAEAPVTAPTTAPAEAAATAAPAATEATAPVTTNPPTTATAPATTTDAPAVNAPATAPAGAAAAESVTTKSAPSTAAKASSSTADEKAAPAKKPAPSPASKATPASKASSKKRRKRGGLSALFVALGCLSSDEFDDDTPNKSKPPKGAAAPKSSPSANPTNTAGTATPKNAPAAAATNGKSASSANGPTTAKTDASKDVPKDTNVADGVIIRSPEPTVAPLDETAGLTSSAVQAPGSGSEIIHQHMLHRNESEHHLATADANRTTDSGGYTDLSDSEGDDAVHQEMLYEDEFEDEEDRLIAQGGIGIPIDENGNPAPLLPAIYEQDAGRKCLVLDLDETLLHSSFKMLPSADYIVPVEIESQTHNVYVIKRPGVDHFLQEMGKIYEIVVFTASLSKYADPVLDMLDVGRVVRHRLFRESCYNHKGNYVKDLSQLGREMSTCIIIDNSPASYIFHPNNAVPVSTWFNDPHDTELTDLCPFLTDLATVDDVRGVLDGSI